MLDAITRDRAAFRRLYDEKFSRPPHVLRLSPTLVMKTVLQRPGVFPTSCFNMLYANLADTSRLRLTPCSAA